MPHKILTITQNEAANLNADIEKLPYKVKVCITDLHLSVAVHVTFNTGALVQRFLVNVGPGTDLQYFKVPPEGASTVKITIFRKKDAQRELLDKIIAHLQAEKLAYTIKEISSNSIIANFVNVTETPAEIVKAIADEASVVNDYNLELGPDRLKLRSYKQRLKCYLNPNGNHKVTLMCTNDAWENTAVQFTEDDMIIWKYLAAKVNEPALLIARIKKILHSTDVKYMARFAGTNAEHYINEFTPLIREISQYLHETEQDLTAPPKKKLIYALASGVTDPEKLFSHPQIAKLDKNKLLVLKHAAEQGHKEEQFQYACQLFTGVEGIIEKNVDLAMQYFIKAADQGHVNAQYNVGSLNTDKEKYSKANMQTAIKYLLKAAAQGHIRAQLKCGQCYDTGNGVKKDFKQAKRFYKLAADQGEIQAQYNYANCCQFTDDQGASDLSDANKYYLMIILNPNIAPNNEWRVKALQNYAQNCLEGIGMQKDRRQGLYYLKIAADLGVAIAQFEYGRQCIEIFAENKDGTKLHEGMQYMRRAAEQQFAPAQMFVTEWDTKQSGVREQSIATKAKNTGVTWRPV